MDFFKGKFDRYEAPEFESKSLPSWYVRGSFALDNLLGKQLARDVDIYVPKGSKLNRKEVFKLGTRNLPFDVTELPSSIYWPPTFNYNLDLYLLTKNGILHPKGYPDKPEIIRATATVGDTLGATLRGIRNSTRYELEGDSDTKAWWVDVMINVYNNNPVAIPQGIEKITSVKERPAVIDKIQEISGLKL